MSKKMSLLFRRLFPCLLVFQVAFLCITMFAAEDTIQDGDVARQYTHMIAMWEAGTPFVPDWVYTTTMELDTAVFLALPFYAVTKDAVLSFCCANVVNILLWIALVFLLCHRVNRIASFYIDPCLASILVLIPYSTGSLYYWNMMFLNCSPYTLKVALPLLLIFLLLPPHHRKIDYILLCVYLFLLFLTSLSSGIYVAAMGIAPILLVFAALWLFNIVHLTPYYCGCTFGSVAVTLLGLLAGRLMGVDITGGQMILNSMSSLAENTANNFIGFLRLFGAVTRDKTSVTRLSGIAQLLCWALALFMLCRGALVVFRTVRSKIHTTDLAAVYLVAPAVWNFLFLTILDTHYGDPYFEVRYHLIGGIPLLLLAASHRPAARLYQFKRFRRALYLVGTLAVCGLMFLCDRRAYLVYFQPEGTVGINQKEHQLCAEIEKLEVTDVFVLQSNTTAEICTLLDPGHSYKLLWLQDERCFLRTFDGPMSEIDATVTAAPAALVLTDEYTLSDLPAYLQTAEEVSATDDYTIYLLQNGSVPDGVVGLPYHGQGVDYADSTGYEYHGSIDPDRSLSASGQTGVVLRSPSLSFCATTDITLEWSSPVLVDDTMGVLTLYQGDQVVAQQDLTSLTQQTTLGSIPAGENYFLTVETSENLTLHRILFTPSNTK